ncbi:hypothetical protein CAP35_08200 [Chitinophagaceae bacterium IBVUCB1]|nr:hypothetical protein CAP35_08200 [Chitinophagaceae bacterium IBVUCB1]
MKLRIKGSSVRMRVTKSEMDKFAKEGLVEELVEFGTTTLAYRLQRSDAATMTATFADNVLTVYMPADKADEWARTEKVGYEHNMDTGDGKKLYLLLEKDFKCLDETHENQDDNYDNPAAILYNMQKQ